MPLFNMNAVPAATPAVTPVAPVQVAPVQAPTQSRPKRPAPDAWGNIEMPKSDGSSDWLRNKFIRIDHNENDVEKQILEACEMAYAAHIAEGNSAETFDYTIDVKLHINPANGATARESTGAFMVSNTTKEVK